MLRGTLRYKGWCSTLSRMIGLGLLGQEELDLAGKTYRDFLNRLVPGDLRSALDADLLAKLEWLGLTEETALPSTRASALDILAGRMIERLSYAEGERDMIILQHQFVAEYPDTGRAPEKISSTLVDYGIPRGDSAMSRTVGLPAAISARLILEGRVEEKGVCIPVKPGLYGPILKGLKELGLVFKEKREAV